MSDRDEGLSFEFRVGRGWVRALGNMLAPELEEDLGRVLAKEVWFPHF